MFDYFIPRHFSEISPFFQKFNFRVLFELFFSYLSRRRHLTFPGVFSILFCSDGPHSSHCNLDSALLFLCFFFFGRIQCTTFFSGLIQRTTKTNIFSLTLTVLPWPVRKVDNALLCTFLTPLLSEHTDCDDGHWTLVTATFRYFSVSLSIGHPPKAFDLDIDTGSDLTWVQCDAPCIACTKVTLFCVIESLSLLVVCLLCRRILLLVNTTRECCRV